MNCLHYIARISDSCTARDSAKMVFEKAPELINTQDSLGKTPLMHAIEANNDPLANKLVKHFKCDVNIANNDGETALFYVVKLNKENLAETLLSAEANVNHMNNNGETAIFLARQSISCSTIADMLDCHDGLENPDLPVIYTKKAVISEISKHANEEGSILNELKSLKDSQNYRKISKVTDEVLGKLAVLKSKFPNFIEVIEAVIKNISLQLLSPYRHIRLRPILIHGGPGIGKTRFAKELSHALDVSFHRIDCGNIEPQRAFSGYNPSYRNATPGRITQYLLESEKANPIMMLDEFEKLSTQSKDPFGATYALLEQETSSNFRDEYYNIQFDFSHVLWLATANDISIIPSAIMSRFMTFKIPNPTREQMEVIIQSVYGDILVHNKDHWGSCFEPKIEDKSIIDALTNKSPRELYTMMESAMGSAAMKVQKAGVTEGIRISSEDFDSSLIHGKRSFGF